MVSASVKVLARGVNRALVPLGAQIVSAHDWADTRKFLPFEQTIAAAAKAGLSIPEYVDVTYNVVGATQDTINQMVALGVFADGVNTVAEIGPGSGRYLEKVLRLCSPSHYEFYETAQPWSEYLLRSYGNVIARPTDGNSMRFTPDASVDLVQAHKVFVATPFLTTCSYWKEMIRVVRPAGHIVFDVVTETCMDPETLDLWLDKVDSDGSPYPAIMPKEFAVSFFRLHDIELVGSFEIPMRPGKTETFVFRRP
jgi:hypothetical protein